MNKTILMLLSVVLIVALCGCTSDLGETHNADISEQNPFNQEAPAEIPPTEETLKKAAIMYISEQEENPWGEYIPNEKDPETGRILCMYTGKGFYSARICEFIAKTESVQYVKSIPELSPPVIHVGKDMIGNHKKLYHSTTEGIVEFSFDEPDSLSILILIGMNGTVYPEVKELVVEDIIKEIQREVEFGDKDILRDPTNWGRIEVKTQETADRVFECMRNCVKILDLTNVPNDSYYLIKIGSKDATYKRMYCKYRGQALEIIFADEDAKALDEYFNMLAKQNSDN